MGDTVSVSGSIVNTNTNTSLDKWNFGVREAGTAQALITKTDVTSVGGEQVTATNMNFATTPAMAGKTLELYIYRDDADASLDQSSLAQLK